MSQAPDYVPQATQARVEEDGHKVFVGNIAFQTTEAELAELFSHPVPVLRANIITRGNRSLGFGFVAFETLDQAEEAVKNYNKFKLGGREINVEVANPRTERPPKERTPKQPKAENKDAILFVDENGEATDVKPRTGRASRPRRNKAKKAKNEGEEGTSQSFDADASANTYGDSSNNNSNKDVSGSGRRKRNNRRKPRGTNGDNNFDGEDGAQGSSSASTATPKERPAHTPRKTGPPSKTTVFVANLPFTMEDEGLRELFSEFKVVSAHVVHRQTGRSKGFGFVELADEAEQLKVLEKMKDRQAEGRTLSIKVALSEAHSPEKDDNKAESNGSFEETL